MIDTTHLHPMLIHFPIAIIVIGFLAETLWIFFKKEIALSKISFYLLLIGTLSAFVALLTGKFFTPEMEGTAGRIQEIHEIFAWTTLGILIILSVLRIVIINNNKENFKLKWFTFVLYGLAATSVSITGYFGGTLVYNYMIPL